MGRGLPQLGDWSHIELLLRLLAVSVLAVRSREPRAELTDFCAYSVDRGLGLPQDSFLTLDLSLPISKFGLFCDSWL